MKNKQVAPSLRFKKANGEDYPPWEQRKLSHLGKFTKGRGYSKKDLGHKGSPIVLYGNLYTNYQSLIKKPDSFAIPRENSIVSKGREVLIPASGETSEEIARASAIIVKETLLGGDLNVYTPGELLDPHFVALSITYGPLHKRLSKLAQGKTVVHLQYSSFQDEIINFPQREEQEKISTFFETFDGLITLHQRKVESVKKLKKALLQKMFPKEGETASDMRFPGFTDAWEQRKFQEITQRVSIFSISSIDLPSVEYEDIEAGSGTLKKDVTVKRKNKKGIVFDKNDILFGKLRPYLMNWLLADFKGVAVGDFWVLRSQNFDPKFVYSLIQSKSFQEVANRSSGSKMPRADWKLVSNALFLISSQNNEQRKIGDLFYSLDNLITLHQR